MPPSLSAQASLEVAVAIGENAARFHARRLGDLSSSSAPGPASATDDATSGLTYTQVASELCLATETLQRYAGSTTATIAGTAAGTDTSALDSNAEPPGDVACTLIHALGDVAERLKDCLGDASALKASLAALQAEETLAEIALRDYDDRPAEHLA